MEHMKRAYYFYREAIIKCIKIKNIMTKSFCSKNIEPND